MQTLLCARSNPRVISGTFWRCGPFAERTVVTS